MAEKTLRTPVTLDYIRDVLDYDASSGKFKWKKNLGSRARAGGSAGYTSPSGYVSIRLKKRLFIAHRIAWVHFYGEWPDLDVDHINGNPSDNRIANLRLATASQNLANSKIKKNSSSGHKGVYWDKQHNKYRVRVVKDYKAKHVGLYANLDEAIAAYTKAAVSIHGLFARGGQIGRS